MVTRVSLFAVEICPLYKLASLSLARLSSVSPWLGLCLPLSAPVFSGHVCLRLIFHAELLSPEQSSNSRISTSLPHLVPVCPLSPIALPSCHPPTALARVLLERRVRAVVCHSSLPPPSSSLCQFFPARAHAPPCTFPLRRLCVAVVCAPAAPFPPHVCVLPLRGRYA